MASIRKLKKEINDVIGDIIEAVYVVESTHGDNLSKEGEKIVDDAISVFDQLISRIHEKNAGDSKAHFRKVQADLEVEARALVERVNALDGPS